MSEDAPSPSVLLAPAKLTTSLRVLGIRPDGFHLLEAEMVTLDLADTLEVVESAEVAVTWEVDDALGASGTRRSGGPGRSSSLGGDDLVVRALERVGRRARVRVQKRIPPGAGLGGGSADAAAILRWSGCQDLSVAVGLGADVPFCVVGGRALVGGIGEQVSPLAHEDRSFVVLLVPFGVPTAAVYAAWDQLAAGGPPSTAVRGNDLEVAALRVEPRLEPWRRAFAAVTGREPRLAGSGSSWFVEGSLDAMGIDDPLLRMGDEVGRMVTARTVPPSI